MTVSFTFWRIAFSTGVLVVDMLALGTLALYKGDGDRAILLMEEKERFMMWFGKGNGNGRRLK